MKRYFCNKCGRTAMLIGDENTMEVCDCCGNIINEIDKNTFLKYVESEKVDYADLPDLLKLFDDDLFQRKKVLEKKCDDAYKSGKEYSFPFSKDYTNTTKNVPRCPTCQSIMVSKIGTVGRASSMMLFGLASGKIGKTMKCSNCGYMW